MVTVPLFPLHTVLFPGGDLHLRIFEPRYVDMIGRCMRESSGFAVALIVEGREAGGAARTVEVGTLARIVDFETLEDGLLGITARGERRLRIEQVSQQSDGLNIAEIEWLPDESPLAVPQQYEILAELLEQAVTQLGMEVELPPEGYKDASWVGMRLAELLPLHPLERQELLEMTDAIERLQRLHARLDVR